MDKRLQQALDFSQYMTTLNNQKRLLWEKYQESLIYYYNGGKFTITPELIAYCNSAIIENIVLIDDNQLPIKVELQKFLFEIRVQYQKASLAYHAEYSKLKSKRSVEKILNA